MLEQIVNKKGPVAHTRTVYCSESGYKFVKEATAAVASMRFERFTKEGTVQISLLYPLKFVQVD